MTVLTRYFLRQLFFNISAITAVLTAALWLTQSLRFIDVVMGKGLSLSAFFKLVALLIPDIIGIILPFSTLIGVLFTYHRFYIDTELVAMRAGGISNFQFIRPAVLMCTGVCVILYGLHLYFLPLSFQKFKDMEWTIRNNITGYLLQPGEFTTFKGITVYVKDRRRNGDLRGILIYDDRRSDNPFTVLAEDGFYAQTPTGMQLTLINGSRQETDRKTGKPSLLTFNRYTVDLTSPQTTGENRTRKPYERFLGDLWDAADAKDNPRLARKLEIEAHQRILVPLTVFGFVLMALGFFLKGEFSRRGRGRGRRVWMAVFSTLILEVGLLTFLNLSERFYMMTEMAYFLVFAYPFLGLWLLWERGTARPYKGTQS